MDFQDWNEHKWDKRCEKPKGISNSTHLNNEMRKGNTIQKLKSSSANHNKVDVVTNLKKIEKEEDTFKHKEIGTDVGKRIALARCEKKLTQKQLANALSVPESIIKNFETGKAIYNAVVLNKIEKYLEKRVRI